MKRVETRVAIDWYENWTEFGSRGLLQNWGEEIGCWARDWRVTDEQAANMAMVALAQDEIGYRRICKRNDVDPRGFLHYLMLRTPPFGADDVACLRWTAAAIGDPSNRQRS